MRRAVLALVFLFLPAAAQAQLPTIRDIVELSKAGLSEEVLLALIEVHQPVYPIDTETLKYLKGEGVSQKVILAMVKSGRAPLPQPDPQGLPLEQPPPPAPTVVVIEHHEEPRVQQVAVPVPVYVAVPTYPVRRIHDRDRDHDGRHDQKRVEPVYWGWGGKLRPDAWKPSHADVKKDPRDRR